VLELTEVELDETTGVLAVLMVVVSVAAVEDLVVWLQPLRANPASISVNKIECFIGGLSCPLTDRSRFFRFATHPGAVRTVGNLERARAEGAAAARQDFPRPNLHRASLQRPNTRAGGGDFSCKAAVDTDPIACFGETRSRIWQIAPARPARPPCEAHDGAGDFVRIAASTGSCGLPQKTIRR
jgi:hypothetical protein